MSNSINPSEVRFLRFHENNPVVFTELLALAVSRMNKGENRIGARALWEELRATLEVDAVRAALETLELTEKALGTYGGTTWAMVLNATKLNDPANVRQSRAVRNTRMKLLEEQIHRAWFGRATMTKCGFRPSRSPKPVHDDHRVRSWRSERSDAGWSYLVEASSLRREGPDSTTRWALWMRRSQTASATVGSPRYSW